MNRESNHEYNKNKQKTFELETRKIIIRHMISLPSLFFFFFFFRNQSFFVTTLPSTFSIQSSIKSPPNHRYKVQMAKKSSMIA